MRDYPQSLSVSGWEPVPRRVRAFLGGRAVLDTLAARYVWEHAAYPQYYIPFGDVDASVLFDEGQTRQLKRGKAKVYGLRVGSTERPDSLHAYDSDADPAVAGTVKVDWKAMDAWFEEDEQVYVHPRNPYARVDAVRSNRPVRIELDGTVLAEAPSSVMVFETGLPTRYYLDRTTLDLSVLEPSDTVTECPYKGVTSGYWSARVGDRLIPDLAWTYAFPTRQLLPIAGLVAFYNERVDITLDGVRLDRPETTFS